MRYLLLPLLLTLAACAAPPPSEDGRVARTGAYGPTVSIGGGISSFYGVSR
ncbi:hypothetical protein [Rhodovarius crocodyli]|uniref:hypothetical protein n=1 Tax=Rhodovarius crocodyli TaxID=1979269 RepID=UPI0013E3769C|nr:hypothetical protein [Rhodovarius crocodyli]